MKPASWGAMDAPRIYTDAPANCIRLPGGFLDFDAPCNVVVQRTATDLCLGNATARLSIRCAFNGSRHFETDGGHYALDDTSYLLLNLGQTVSSRIRSKTPVECFNITFQPGFAEDVLRSMVTRADHLLDAPRAACGQPVQFFVRLYPHDDTLSPVLFHLRSTLDREPVTQGWLEEQFHLLLERLLQAHRNIRREVETMPALRPATRAEIYQRLYRARDFMAANLSRRITLDDIADVACFSTHHFLRVFKQVFHVTPHQYLIQLRLDWARTLLYRTDRPVMDIGSAVGFESASSFSWLFRRRFGVSPQAFRNGCGRGEEIRSITPSNQ